MLSRLCIFITNIFFPPLSVFLLTTPTTTDTLLSCLLFLAGVLPSHIHAFYLSYIYFSRRKRVRKGKWPGARPAFIFDERVGNGGVGRGVVEELRLRGIREKEGGRRRRREGGGVGVGV